MPLPCAPLCPLLPPNAPVSINVSGGGSKAKGSAGGASAAGGVGKLSQSQAASAAADGGDDDDDDSPAEAKPKKAAKASDRVTGLSVSGDSMPNSMPRDLPCYPCRPRQRRPATRIEAACEGLLPLLSVPKFPLRTGLRYAFHRVLLTVYLPLILKWLSHLCRGY